MGTETVVRNSGSATGSITCPKCGYAQEERLDCRKCGIIFSKYYALHPPDKSAEGKGIENSNPQEPSSQELKLLVSDIQLQIRDITAKFSETEFEKAERNRLQKELKELDQKFQSSLEELTARLEGYEKRLEDLSVPKQQPESGADLSVFEDRLKSIEDKLNGLSRLNHQFNDLVEKYGINFQQILELREQWSGLKNEYQEAKSQMDQLRKEHEADKSGKPIEEELRSIMCKYLDDFRQLLESSNKNQ